MQKEIRIFHGHWINMNRFEQNLYIEIGYDKLTYEHIVIWKNKPINKILKATNQLNKK